MARYLDVYLHSDRVGRLEQDDHGDLGFQYASAWLDRPNAVALSLSLPLRAEPFSRRECRPFFAGLLPEEHQRSLLAEAFRISERNDFSLLDKIGGECAGAVSLMPPGQQPELSTQVSKPLTLEELAEKLAALPKKPLLAGDQGLRLSLAGAQSKMAVIVRNGAYALPVQGTPSSHILKPQSPRFDHLVENEFFCMRLAALAGLKVAEVQLGEAGGARFLQITRYDRESLADGRLRRLHQEDFCQALGCVPEQKYQQEGGPGLRQCFELIRSVSSAPALDVLHLLDAVVFNALIGNGDAHGKNFSLVHRAGTLRLAPLYDLICTQAYPELDQRFAMKIGKHREPDRIGREDWLAFLSETHLGVAPAKRRMLNLIATVEALLERGLDSGNDQDAITSCIRANAVRLRHALQ